MLIGFKVGNYKSFNELIHFSMTAGKTRSFVNHIYNKNNLDILKFSAIYSANASGKSNFVKSIGFSQAVILTGVSGIYNNQYFRVNKDNIKLPSYFEYEIEKDNKLYSYGFEINIYNASIISEWLIDMTKNKQVVIFERDAIKHKITSDLKIKGKNASNLFNACKNEMEYNNNIFFITEMNRRLSLGNNYNLIFNDFINVFDFFLNDLQIIGQNKKIKISYLTKYKENIIPILTKLGLDISNILEVDSNLNEIKEQVNDVSFNNLMLDLNNKKNSDILINQAIRVNNKIYIIKCLKGSIDVKELKIKHSYSDEYFETYEESAGTLRILELIDVLLATDKVFLIDEIDRCLHPSLTIEFVKSFLNSNNKNVQLIITTHESRLLTYDILRRDEVWFVEKNDKGASEIYSLEQFKDDARFDRRIDKAYLEGRYGAIPIFNDNVGEKDENKDK